MGRAGIISMDCVFGGAGDLEVFARLVYVGTPLPLGVPQMSPESGISTPGGLALLVKRLLGARPSGMSDGPAPQIGAIVCATEASVDAATMAATLSFYGTPGPREGFDQGRIAEALELAQAWLTQGAADLVLLASHDQVGTCGIVIAPAQAVSPARIYALVESVTVGVTEQGSALYRRGLAEAGATPAEVGLLQVSDWPPSAELAAGYVTASEDLTCAVGTTPVRPDPQRGRPPGEGAVSPLWNRDQGGALSPPTSDPTDRLGFLAGDGIRRSRRAHSRLIRLAGHAFLHRTGSPTVVCGKRAPHRLHCSRGGRGLADRPVGACPVSGDRDIRTYGHPARSSR